MTRYQIPTTALSLTDTEDALADLNSLNRSIQADLFNLGGDDGTDVRALFPAQFVKDLKALMDEWYEAVVDGPDADGDTGEADPVYEVNGNIL